MLLNVTTIKRHNKRPFPDFWPTTSYEATAHSLLRQQPDRIPQQVYTFAVKPDLPGAPYSIIIQPNNVTLFNGFTKGKKTDGDCFSRWCNLHTRSFNRLSELGFSGTIVGKMAKNNAESVFCVYYIVLADKILLDYPSIAAALRIREDMFDDTLVILPVTKTVHVTVDKEANTVVSKDLGLGGGLSGAIVGFPVVIQETRTAEDSTEIEVPRLYSSGIHMRFSAFIYTLAGRRG